MGVGKSACSGEEKRPRSFSQITPTVENATHLMPPKNFGTNWKRNPASTPSGNWRSNLPFETIPGSWESVYTSKKTRVATISTVIGIGSRSGPMAMAAGKPSRSHATPMAMKRHFVWPVNRGEKALPWQNGNDAVLNLELP